MKFSDAWGVEVLCRMIDQYQQDAASLKYFESYAQLYEDSVRLLVRTPEPPPSSPVAAQPSQPATRPSQQPPPPSQPVTQLFQTAPAASFPVTPPVTATTALVITAPIEPPPAKPKPAKVVDLLVPISLEDYNLVKWWLAGQ